MRAAGWEAGLRELYEAELREVRGVKRTRLWEHREAERAGLREVRGVRRAGQRELRETGRAVEPREAELRGVKRAGL